MLSKEERLRILKTLEQDVEFRYALMGALGMQELLDRFTRLEERQQKLEERLVRLEERFAELEERFAKLEERFARLEERQQKLEERVWRVEEAIVSLQRTLATIAHRFGVLSEGAFREAIKGIVEELIGGEAYRWTVYDRDGIVYGHPSQVEVDVVTKNSKHILIEVKSRVDASDILELTRIKELYRRKEGVEPELAIVGGFISPKARKLAEKLNIKIYTYIE